MMKVKILSTSKKNSDWYFDSCILFHMISFMKVFTEIRLFDSDSANAITNQEVKSTQIDTIQINLNDKMLEMKDVQYISNIMSNLLFTDLLEEQEFDFNLIFKTDSKKQFKIIDM